MSKKDVSIKESLRLNIVEGGVFGAMNGLTQNFLVPFALLFSASNFMVSLITTLPGLVGSIVQLMAPRFLKIVRSARRYIVLGMVGHAFIWLLLGLLPFIAESSLVLDSFFILILIGAVFSLMINPVWMTYMGELVPISRRARYFGNRNAVAGVVTFGATMLAGVILSVASGATGFAVLFFLAALLRLAGGYCINESKEIAIKFPAARNFSIKRFVKQAPTTDFGRFVSLAVFLRLMTYLAAPFFFVYQLQVLNLNYFLFTVLQVAAVISSFLSMRYWANLADKRGNRVVLMYSSFIIAFVPLLWVTTKAFPALFVFELVSGLSWAGFNLASSNYMLEASSAKNRPYAISYFNLFNQLAIVGGGILGAGLLGLFGLMTSSAALPFLLLFGVSGVLRLIVVYLTKPKLKELRFVEVGVKRGQAMTFINVLPQQGAVYTALEAPDDFVRDKLRVSLDRGREFDEFVKQGVPRGVVKRMKPKERALMRDRFIERAAGRKIPKKPRGLKK